MVVEMIFQAIKKSNVNSTASHNVEIHTGKLMKEMINFVSQLLIPSPLQKRKKNSKIFIQKKAKLSSRCKKKSKLLNNHHYYKKISTKNCLPIAIHTFNHMQFFAKKPLLKRLSKFSAQLIQQIPPHFFKDMPLEQLQEITSATIEKLTMKQILELLIWRSWLLSEQLIQQVPPKDIRLIPPKCIQKMTPRTFKMMSTKQFEKITPLQIQAMRPIHMCAISPQYITIMTKKQIRALQPSHIAALNTNQLLSLIVSGKLLAMTQKQLTNIPSNIRTKIHLLKRQIFPKYQKKSESSVHY